MLAQMGSPSRVRETAKLGSSRKTFELASKRLVALLFLAIVRPRVPPACTKKHETGRVPQPRLLGGLAHEGVGCAETANDVSKGILARMILQMLQIYEHQLKSYNCWDAISHLGVVTLLQENSENDGVDKAEGVGTEHEGVQE